MPQLIIELPGEPSRTVPVSSDALSLGRADDNDVVLTAEEVSRHHAKIHWVGDQVVLQDCNSMNGTWVNQQRIVERVLKHMDEIWFGGKCRVIFRNDTKFGRNDKPTAEEERGEDRLSSDLDRIRAEMDRVGNSMTLIGKSGDVKVHLGTPADAAAKPEEMVQMGKAFRRLTALYQAGKLIASDFDLDKRLRDVVDLAVDLLDADRGFIMFKNSQTGQLEARVARGMGAELEGAGSPSMGIAGRAAIDGAPVLMADADSDEDFGMRDSIIRQNIRSAMCVPLRTENGVLGSIYLDKSRGGETFDEEDLELFVTLGTQLAMAIENVTLHQRMVEAEKTRANLGRFMSPAVVEQIMREEGPSIELGGQNRVVSTLFADVRGFTQIGETIPVGALVGLLNEHFTAMTEIVFAQRGTLDKYNGDEVMALFGAPITGEADAEHAVLAALSMQQRNAQLNVERRERNLPTFDIGIGIATGEVIVGYIGSPDRMDYTVMGDRVNIASRLCSAAKPGQILIDCETCQRVSHLVECRSVGKLELKNKSQPLDAHEVAHLL